MEALGPVLVVLSIPLMLRWVPRNRLYGLRTAATCSSDSVWYDANALAGRHTFFLGLAMVALEFVLPAHIRIVALRTVAIIGIGVILLADCRTANRWQRERGQRDLG